MEFSVSVNNVTNRYKMHDTSTPTSRVWSAMLHQGKPQPYDVLQLSSGDTYNYPFTFGRHSCRLRLARRTQDRENGTCSLDETGSALLELEYAPAEENAVSPKPLAEAICNLLSFCKGETLKLEHKGSSQGVISAVPDDAASDLPSSPGEYHRILWWKNAIGFIKAAADEYAADCVWWNLILSTCNKCWAELDIHSRCHDYMRLMEWMAYRCYHDSRLKNLPDFEPKLQQQSIAEALQIAKTGLEGSSGDEKCFRQCLQMWLREPGIPALVESMFHYIGLPLSEGQKTHLRHYIASTPTRGTEKGEKVADMCERTLEYICKQQIVTLLGASREYAACNVYLPHIQGAPSRGRLSAMKEMARSILGKS